MGIEPTLSAWKAEVLPLNYTRKGRIGTTRFEHATPWSQTRYSTKLSYVPLSIYIQLQSVIVREIIYHEITSFATIHELTLIKNKRHTQ